MASQIARAPASVPRVLPAVVVVGALSAVGLYVRSQLRQESRAMDRYFSQYKSPESEASRNKVFEGQPDPRKSVFNVLGW
ncbi:hypothetical protein CONLIGDRAFT_687376 [Coniochaeta ligniaria NRRL 30616]|uniref:Uncharacterized protein n=1 Tax=Coniochaeta ligniaria NRRL 30616 TaxID=1408157 RepID=A0A1J7J073_9PEZI|nr:hypothetical protein CONLIGDRAFT_687376 [Coniochaeta ligniaria NRRL 30616]